MGARRVERPPLLIRSQRRAPAKVVLRFASVTAGCVLVMACAGQTTANPAKSSGTTGALYISELLPLEDNTVLEFDTSVEGTGEKGCLVMQVRRPHGNRIELNVAGKIRRLEATLEGVSIATGGWLLKQPFTVGARYQGLSGPVTVIGINRDLIVPAGRFTRCVETEEVTSTSTTRTTFCPGVGIAKLVIEGQIKNESRREIAELRFHGPRIDIGPEKTTAAPVGQ